MVKGFGIWDLGFGGMGSGGKISVDQVIIALLAVILFLFIAFTDREILVPLINNMGDGMDNAVGSLSSMFKSGGEGYSNCRRRNVTGLVGGKDFLRDTGAEGEDVFLEYCRGMCNVSGGGLNPYRIIGGNIEKRNANLFSSGVEFWDRLFFDFVGDVGDVSRRWEVYHKGVDMLNEEIMKDDFFSEDFSTRKFVLYGDGAGIGDSDITATWQNNKWEVVGLGDGGRVDVDADAGSDVSFEEGIGATFFYDDDKALTAFYNEVKDGWDDNVYWKVLDKDEEYSLADKGEVIGLINRDAASVDELYSAIFLAEHNLPIRTDLKDLAPWIRTKVKGSGSTAYGPAQLTMSLAKNYLGGDAIVWTDEEKSYLNRFIDQGCLFLLHGGGKVDRDQLESKKCGEVYERLNVDEDTKYDYGYDYGGNGDLTGAEDRVLYKRIVMKMLGEIGTRNDYKLDAIWREWRFGSKDMYKYKCDKKNGEGDRCFEYKTRFYSILGGEDSELDGEEEIRVLKYNFAKMKAGFLKVKSPPDEVIDRFRDNISGMKIYMLDKEFVVDVVKSENGFSVLFSSDLEKFGLKHYPYGKTEGSFGKLDVSPFILIGKSGESWKLIGNEEYYKLPKEKFKEFSEDALIGDFLKSKCP